MFDYCTVQHTGGVWLSKMDCPIRGEDIRLHCDRQGLRWTTPDKFDVFLSIAQKIPCSTLLLFSTVYFTIKYPDVPLDNFPGR